MSCYSRFALGFTSKRRVAALSDAAFRLWVSSISYAREQLTDGRIETSDLSLIPRGGKQKTWKKSQVFELVSSGLWRETGAGSWLIDDYDGWQESAEKVREKRQKARDRMAGVRANSQRTESERSRDVLSTTSYIIDHVSSDLASEIQGGPGGIEDSPRAANDLGPEPVRNPSEPAVVDASPPSGTRSAPPPPENASTGQPGARVPPRLASELEKWPITERVQWLLAQYSHERDQWAPQNWPESQAALKSFHDATGRVGEKLSSYSRCKSTRGVLELYASGRTQAEVCEGIKFVCESDWWRGKVQDGEKLSLGSITPHMFNMAQPGNPVTGPAKAKPQPKMGEPGWRRQPDGNVSVYDFLVPMEANSA